MYNAFYELQREPFHVTPDPEFLFPSPAHKEALAAIIYGIEQRKGFVAITGEVGVGKTTILRSYLDFADRQNLKLIYIYNSNLTFDELVTTLLQELGVAARPPSTFQAVTALHEALIDVYRKNQTVVLIVDEAQNMPIETLESLRMLSNLETVTEKLIQIMLIGQPEFDELLQQHRLRQLRQRIAIHARIGPLNTEDSIAYLEHRLAKVSLGTKPVFTKNALRMIADASEGIPRNLNILSDNALITGYGYQTRPVNTKIVKEVLADRGYATAAAPAPASRVDRSSMWLQASMAGAAVVALVAGGLAVLQPEFLRGERKAEPSSPPAPVAQRNEPLAQPQSAPPAQSAPRTPEVAAAPRATESAEPTPPPPPPPRVAEPALPMPPAPREPAPSVAAVEPPAAPPAPPRPSTTPAPAERQQVRPVPPVLTPPPPAPSFAAPAPAAPKPAEVARAPAPQPTPSPAPPAATSSPAPNPPPQIARATPVPREPAPPAPPAAAATPAPNAPPQVARATPTPPPQPPTPAPDMRTARSGAAETAAASAVAQAAAQRRAQGPIPLAAPPRPTPPAPPQRPTPSIVAAPPSSAPAAPAAPPSLMVSSASGSGIAAPPSAELADASAGRAVPAPPPPRAQVVKAVRAGDSLWTMAEEVYGFVNPNILRRVQDANPQIRNVNVLAPGQEVVFPRVQESPFDRGTAVSEGLAGPGRN